MSQVTTAGNLLRGVVTEGSVSWLNARISVIFELPEGRELTSPASTTNGTAALSKKFYAVEAVVVIVNKDAQVG